MKNFLCLVFLLLAVAKGFCFDVKSARINKARSTITYSMSHPMHNWKGVSKQVDGVLQYDDKTQKILKVAIVTKVSSFNSKNSNRDSHMMESTEGIKYPSVSFVSTSIEDEGSAVKVKGIITFHGVPKEVQFVAQKKVTPKIISFTGSFEVLLSDFKIERPSLMMIKTDDEVKLDFAVEFVL